MDSYSHAALTLELGERYQDYFENGASARQWKELAEQCRTLQLYLLATKCDIAARDAQKEEKK